MTWTMPIGAQPGKNGTRFRVWAPRAERVEVLLYAGDSIDAIYPLAPEESGYFSAHISGVSPGTRYYYRLDGGMPLPDPAARFQPLGVHGPSQVIDPAAYVWSDAGWQGLPLDDMVIYELHTGAATAEGTFEALIERLGALRDLGVTAIELMPVADFPGGRNWGYDGVCLFAPSRAYGGPEGLRRLVDAAHAFGMAVILDVVYNHLGPDGNYLSQFSDTYFTERHTTPWGSALNFDGLGNAAVREFFIANACYWTHEYHLDGLRLDATHAILDDSPLHILAEINIRLRASLPPGRICTLFAEDERNEPCLVRPLDQGGMGLDAIWADDFHHQMRVALAGDSDSYYADYSGTSVDLAATLRQGWFYTGQLSKHRDMPRGAHADDVAPPRFVYCIENHDQVGNRAQGDRLHHTIGLDAYRAASALLLLSPYTPLLWMGQEWAASTPFLFFTDHHEELGRLVSAGRRAEFAKFAAFTSTEVPDPQARSTFDRSKLRWEERAEPPHAGAAQLYQDLLKARRSLPALRERGRESFRVAPLGATALAMRRRDAAGSNDLLLVVNWRGSVELDLDTQPETMAPVGQRWSIHLDSESPRYGGGGTTFLDESGNRLVFQGPGAVLLKESTSGFLSS